MERTYSKPEREWEGFRPVTYSVRKAWDLPLTLTSDNNSKEEATTVGKLLVSLRDQTIQEIKSGFGGMEIVAGKGSTVVSGPSFNCDVAKAFLEFQRQGINHFDTLWFWYDKDHVTNDLMASYTSFVAHNDRIVREQVTFCDYSSSGFDPAVFESGDDSQPIWRIHPEWHEAWVRYWFRKFYTETRTGQLMVLRPDQPELYYYPEGRWTAQGGSVCLGELLTRIQSLLWVVIVLLGLIALVLILKR